MKSRPSWNPSSLLGLSLVLCDEAGSSLERMQDIDPADRVVTIQTVAARILLSQVLSSISLEAERAEEVCWPARIDIRKLRHQASTIIQQILAGLVEIHPNEMGIDPDDVITMADEILDGATNHQLTLLGEKMEPISERGDTVDGKKLAL